MKTITPTLKAKAISEESTAEDALVRLAQNGDKRAFEKIWLKHADYVFGNALKIVKSHEGAEDVTQQVAINFFRGIARFRMESSVRTLLHRITINLSLNYITRRKRKTGRVTDYLTSDNDDSFGIHVSQITNDRQNLEREILLREQMVLVKRAVSRLSFEHRQVFVLHHLRGLSHEKIARIAECPEGTIRSRLHYALNCIRSMLENSD